VEFHQLDLASETTQSRLTYILEQNIDAVVHFAANKAVAESVVNPEKYFHTNIGATVNLLSAMRQANVTKIVLSSSAAVYGEPCVHIVYEDTPCYPIDPYGQSKLVSEMALENASNAWGLEAIALRYFNVAGALNPSLADTTSTNLMPAILDRITHNQVLQIFGNDYCTSDGTCIRDYIHILDLVDAHLAALNNLRASREPRLTTFNVGTGFGSSVLEIVKAFQSLPDVDVKYKYAPRRPGDPASLTANVDKITEQLSWQAKYTTRDIVESVIDNPPLTS